MQALRDFIVNIEKYGNCEFYARDVRYVNTVFKYVLTINEKKIIVLKKYWCVYDAEFLNKENNDYLNAPLVGQEYLSDNFVLNISEIIMASTNVFSFCTHNLFLDNDYGVIMYENIVPILKYILEDLSFFDHYLIGDINATYEFMENKLQALFNDNKKNIENNPLCIEEIIDIFESYLKLDVKEYNKIKKG